MSGTQLSPGEILGARTLVTDVDVSCDVCVIGSGAGGAVLAAGLAEKGLSVVILEEGSHYTSADFRRLDEAWSFPALYQERGGRATADQAITILQGRSVGGGTTVNWTTCFRTPSRILAHWRGVHGLEALTDDAMAPHFAAVEERLGIRRWEDFPPNANNSKLWQGAQARGLAVERTARNVRGCVNSGYCGFGCPVDAKQAMHLTYIPDALAAGATLYSDTRADRLEVVDGRITAVHATVLDPARDTARAGAVRVTVRPERVASCGGAINTPALLLRSGIDAGPVGRRTFLHPVVSVGGRYTDRVDGWYGAPQSVASHAHVDRGPDELGLFFEHAPIHPMLAGVSLPGIGERKQRDLAALAYTSSMIGLAVDGLVRGDDGGTVTLRSDGRIRVDYPITEPLRRAFRFAIEEMVRMHLAAGAVEVSTLHAVPVVLRSADEIGRLDAAGYGAHDLAVFSAHQMGGAAMGPDPATSVVDPDLRHHQIANLFVVDGSVLPTALGVNPSETIYGLAHRARDVVGA